MKLTLDVKAFTTPLDYLPEEEKKKYRVCIIDKKVRELTYKFQQDEKKEIDGSLTLCVL